MAVGTDGRAGHDAVPGLGARLLPPGARLGGRRAHQALRSSGENVVLIGNLGPSKASCLVHIDPLISAELAKS